MTNELRVVSILHDVTWEPNAPEAEFVTSDSGVAVLLLRAHPNDQDRRSVAIFWTGVVMGSFGGPNDEGLPAHPLYLNGLSTLRWAGEVVDSRDILPSQQRRFIVPTKEGVAEVEARNIGSFRVDASVAASAALRMIPTQHAPRAFPTPLRIEVESLTEQTGPSVIRLPQRRFPGVLVQGDSLSILVSDANDVAAALAAAEEDVAMIATELRDRLTELLDGYERALAAHDLPLPYQRDRPER